MAAVQGSVCGPVTAAEARPPVWDDGEWPTSFLFTAISLAHTRSRSHTHLSLIVVCGAHVNRLFVFFSFSEARFVVRNRGQWGLSGGCGMEKSVVCDPDHVQPVGRSVDQ